MSLEREQSIVELKTILDRNDTRLPEELDIINSTPDGHMYGSPKDIERWNDLSKTLEEKRLATHIENSKNKLGEEQFLKDMVEVTLPAMIRRKTEEKQKKNRQIINQDVNQFSHFLVEEIMTQ
jgi:hypothetical protein